MLIQTYNIIYTIMDYQKIYNSLVERAKARKFNKNDYYEVHHIIPTCIGGKNISENKIKLTYREHFLMHWMLHIIYPKSKGLASAFHITAFGTNCRNTRKNTEFYMPSSRSLEAAKIARIIARTGTKHSEETKEKMKESHKIRRELGIKNKPSPPLTEETKNNMRLAKLGKKRKPFTEEHKAKLRAGKLLYHPLKGKHHTKETIEKLKDAHRRKGHNMSE